MTREEAIEKLNNAKGCPLLYDSHIEAIDMAIQALSQEPISLNDINNALGASFRNGVRSAKVEQEPCDDAISRAEAQTEIMMSKSITAFDRDLWIRTKDAVHILRELPSVTPSRQVIENIKADIEAARYGLINDGLDVALRIIDKHIEGR